MTGYGTGGYAGGFDKDGLPPAAGPYGSPQQYGQQYDQAAYGQPAYGQSPYGQQQYPQQQPMMYGQPHAAPAMYTPYGQPMMTAGAPFGVDPMTGIPFSDKSKSTAGLLQLFFGGFGVGRFYLGHTGIAVTQLVLTLFGLITALFIVGGFVLMAVGIWAFVDAIMMFTGSVRDAQGRVLR